MNKKRRQEVNPFLINNPIIVINQREIKTFYSKEDELISVPQKYVADQSFATKIYNVLGFEEALYELSGNELKLFIYICFHLRSNGDYLELNPSVLMKKFNIKSTTTFRKMRKKLESLDIITKKKGRRNIYWVNPHKLFCGNRPSKIKDFYGEEYSRYPIKKSKQNTL